MSGSEASSRVTERGARSRGAGAAWLRARGLDSGMTWGGTAMVDDGMLLRALLDSELDARVVLSAVRDDEGRIVDFVFTEANAAACENMGIARDRLLGSGLAGTALGDSATDLLRGCVDVVQTGEPLVLNDFRYDSGLTDAEPSYFDVRAVRVGDGFSASWRDVSDRFRAARDIALSEERYRLLAENMSDFVLITNAAGIIEWLSPSVERRLGWTPQELLGHSTAEFVHPDDHAVLIDARSRVEAGEVASFRLRIGRSDDTYYWCALIVHPVYDAAGHVRGPRVGLPRRAGGGRGARGARGVRGSLPAAGREHVRLRHPGRARRGPAVGVTVRHHRAGLDAGGGHRSPDHRVPASRRPPEAPGRRGRG